MMNGNMENGGASGVVVSVNVSTEKGTVKRPVSEIVFDECGIRGDAHAGEWHRQVSLLGRESVERFGADAGRQFRWGDFAENITTEGLDLGRVAPLDRFRIGPAELEVTQCGKKCHGGGCAIFQEVGQCVMPKDGIFCRVIAGGVVTSGDTIVWTPYVMRIRILTLSDRASRGTYEDRSGPRIREWLNGFFEGKRWHATFETAVLPDDGALLRGQLESARDGGAAAVFTTGGTGIGARDVTPDVVAALADKLLPGVMESIRLKFGAGNPNALLSRSVAAVLDQTLVYTLPGSASAVDEYMGEILKTFEHAVLMLHGLDGH